MEIALAFETEPLPCFAAVAAAQEPEGLTSPDPGAGWPLL